MIDTRPHVRGNANDARVRRIGPRHVCAQTGVACADACFGEDMATEPARRVRLDADGAAGRAAKFPFKTIIDGRVRPAARVSEKLTSRRRPCRL